MAFQKYSNMEQSMFTRFVQLGVPAVQLDAQGRARPSLCQLYQWCYDNLGNLPHVLKSPEYQLANAGFQYDYQLINVEDYNGTGETQPNPYFYQVNTSVCLCVCTCVHVCIHLCVYACMHVCMCMSVCIRVCVLSVCLCISAMFVCVCCSKCCV